MGKVHVGNLLCIGHKLWYRVGCGPGMPGPYRVVESKADDVDEVDGDIFNIGGELLWKALAICSLL